MAGMVPARFGVSIVKCIGSVCRIGDADGVIGSTVHVIHMGIRSPEHAATEQSKNQDVDDQSVHSDTIIRSDQDSVKYETG